MAKINLTPADISVYTKEDAKYLANDDRDYLYMPSYQAKDGSTVPMEQYRMNYIANGIQYLYTAYPNVNFDVLDDNYCVPYLVSPNYTDDAVTLAYNMEKDGTVLDASSVQGFITSYNGKPTYTVKDGLNVVPVTVVLNPKSSEYAGRLVQGKPYATWMYVIGYKEPAAAAVKAGKAYDYDIYSDSEYTMVDNMIAYGGALYQQMKAKK